MSTLREQLDNLILPVVETMGYEYVGTEHIAQGKYSVLRICIDKPDGITVDDCAIVSRQVGAVLDVEDPLSGRYTLEVSSPGLNRPLFTLAHYQQQLGKNIRVRLFTPLDGRRKLMGVLQSATDECVVLLQEEGGEISIPLSQIAKANLIFDAD